MKNIEISITEHAVKETTKNINQLIGSCQIYLQTQNHLSKTPNRLNKSIESSHVKNGPRKANSIFCK